jgi:hypothetical protein
MLMFSWPLAVGVDGICWAAFAMAAEMMPGSFWTDTVYGKGFG